MLSAQNTRREKLSPRHDENTDSYIQAIKNIYSFRSRKMSVLAEHQEGPRIWVGNQIVGHVGIRPMKGMGPISPLAAP